MFELVVPRRTGVNIMCDDQVGDFSVFKLLRDEEGLKPIVWVQLRGCGGEKSQPLPQVRTGKDHCNQVCKELYVTEQSTEHGPHVE